MEKQVKYWKLGIIIVLAGLFDGLFTYFISEVLKIPLFLDTIGILFVTFTYGGVPGLLTALCSQFFSEWIGGYLNFWIYLYVLSSFSAVGVVCIFRKSIKNAHSVISVIIFLFVTAIVMCFAVSITGGLVNAIGDVFEGVHGGNIQTDYFKISLHKINIPDLAVNILGRFPTNIIDRPISVFASYGLYLLKNKYSKKLAENKAEKAPADEAEKESEEQK